MRDVPSFPVSARAADVSPAALMDALPPAVMASDYQWLSLKSWNPDALVSRLNGSLVVDFTDYHDPRRRLVGFAGGKDPVATASQLIEYLQANSRAPELQLVDETAAAALTQTFSCEPDRDHADYIYSTSDLAELAGSRHQVLRNQLRRFERRFGPSAEIEIVRPSAGPWADVIELKEKWAANSALPSEAQYELRALLHCASATVDAPPSSQIIVTLLRIDGTIAGFDVSEITRGGWAVLHFRHTPHELVGSYGYLVSHVAQHLAAAGVADWNAEQDLGLPGLRTRKTRDRPARLIEKYRVRLLG